MSSISSRAMPGSATTKRAASAAPAIDTSAYAVVSTRPLHVLAFLLPLIVVYEIGSVVYLTHPGAVETIGAHSILGRFFSTFGVASVYLPGIALAAVLLVWHMLLRDPWKLRPGVLIGMLFEAILWTLPLLVLALLLFGDRGQEVPGALAPTAETAATIKQLPWQARLTLSIGAGIYEELLFRLMLLTGLHFLIVDVFRASHNAGCIIAAVVSAVAFALYHNTIYRGEGTVHLLWMGFYTIAGLYFSTIFLVRGFGVAVGTHAVYDIIALVVLANVTGPNPPG